MSRFYIFLFSVISFFFFHSSSVSLLFPVVPSFQQFLISKNKKEAYEITLLSVHLCIHVLVFYAVRVVWKKSRILVLPRTSFFFFLFFFFLMSSFRFFLVSSCVFSQIFIFVLLSFSSPPNFSLRSLSIVSFYLFFHFPSPVPCLLTFLCLDSRLFTVI
jgi:hypothetical protein